MEKKTNCNGEDCIAETGFLTAGEVIEEFRSLVGDTTRDIPTKSLLGYLRFVLNYLAREKGLETLFEYEDTFDLLRLNNEGDYAASWVLNGGANSNIGYIVDIKYLEILDNTGKPFVVDVSYIPYTWFRKTYPLPERTKAGTPSAFTIRTIQGRTKIIFNCPIARPFAVNMHYAAAHPRVVSERDLVRVPYMFVDIICQMMQILYKKEASDYAEARADWEDLDYLVAQAREMIFRNPSGFPYRRIRRSY